MVITPPMREPCSTTKTKTRVVRTAARPLAFLTNRKSSRRNESGIGKSDHESGRKGGRGIPQRKPGNAEMRLRTHDWTKLRSDETTNGRNQEKISPHHSPASFARIIRRVQETQTHLTFGVLLQRILNVRPSKSIDRREITRNSHKLLQRLQVEVNSRRDSAAV